MIPEIRIYTSEMATTIMVMVVDQAVTIARQSYMEVPAWRDGFVIDLEMRIDSQGFYIYRCYNWGSLVVGGGN